MTHTNNKYFWKIISVFTLCLFMSTTYANDWNAETHNVILGDFDGDGIDDLLLQAKNSLYLNRLLKGDGSGVFSEAYDTWGQNNLGINWSDSASEIITGDFIGDSNDDLLIRSKTGGNHKILLADTRGAFTSVSFDLPNNHLGLDWGVDSSNIKVGDFNNDRYSDILLQAKDKGRSSTIVLADSSGNISIINQTLTSGHLGIDWSAASYNIIAGDFNGDGSADLFLQSKSTLVIIPMDELIVPVPLPQPEGHVLLYSDANGHFNNIAMQWKNDEIARLNLDAKNYNIYSADFDNDGKSELLLQSKRNGTHYILKVDDTGSLYIHQEWSDGVLGAPWSENDSILHIINLGTNLSDAVLIQSKDTNNEIYLSSPDSTGILGAVSSTSVTWTPEVGYTPGNLSVGDAGESIYSIEIKLPSAVAGDSPNLNLTYSSNSGNGYLGHGWTIKGITAVTRCPLTYAQDGTKKGISFDSQDKFCLNGQRLIATSGIYGKSGTKYKTERDNFVRVTSYGSGPDYFIVETKENKKIQYGGANNSTINLSTQTVPYKWMISSRVDQSDNETIHKYNYDASTKEYYISEIEYSRNSGITNTRKVSFVYDSNKRPDVSVKYVHGEKVIREKRLSKIRTWIGSEKVREYKLTYDKSFSTSSSLLKSLEECDASSKCLKESLFQYTDTYSTQSKRLPGGESFPISFGGGTTSVTGEVWDHLTRVADVNGDGRADLVYAIDTETFADVKNGTWRIRLGQDDGFGDEIDTGRVFGGGGQVYDYVQYALYLPFDYNGDGLTDFLNVRNGKWRILQSRKSVVGFKDIRTDILGHGAARRPKVLDINGDGLSDLIYAHLGTIRFRLNEGASFGVEKDTGILDADFEYSHVTDHDGDGLQDLLIPRNGTWQLMKSIGNVFKSSLDDLELSSAGYRDNPKLSDVNGDGLLDLHIFNVNTIDLYINNGVSFEGVRNTGITVIKDEMQFIRVADFNSDGNTDLAVFKNQFTRTIPSVSDHKMYIHLSDGDNYQSERIDAGLTDEYPVAPLFADINGDKLPDYIHTEYWSSNGSDNDTYLFETRIKNGLVPNLLTSIVNGLSSPVEINYSPLTDNNVYEQTTDCSYPVNCVIKPHYVVKSIDIDDGVQSIKQYEYKYLDAKIHLRGRGWLGYTEILTRDLLSRSIVSTKYNNTTSQKLADIYNDRFPYIGIPTSVSHYSETLVPETCCGVPRPELVPYGRFRLVEEQINTVEHVPTVAQSYFSYIKENVTTNYDENGIAFKQARVTYGYDEGYADKYGRLTTKTTFGTNNTRLLNNSTKEDSYEQVESYTYYPSDTTTNYLVNNVNTISITKTKNYYNKQSVLVTDIANTERSFTYYPDSNLVYEDIQEPNNIESYLKTSYEYDRLGNVEKVEVSGHPNASYPVATRSKSYQYSNTENSIQPEITVTNEGGHVTTLRYSGKHGHAVQIIDPNNQITNRTYDGFGRILSEESSDGTSLNTHYSWCVSECPSNASYYTEQTSTGTSPIISYFDRLGREIQTETYTHNNQKVLQDIKYDALGRVLQRSNPYYEGNPVVWNDYSYDDLGRIWGIQQPGSLVKYSYEGLDVTLTKTVMSPSPREGLKETSDTYRYDINGNLIESIDALNNLVNYEYNALGKLVSYVDNNGNKTQLHYDNIGRLESANDPDSGLSEFRYDVFGNLRWSKTAEQDQTKYVYDKLGRMTAALQPEGVSVWEYDSASKGIGKLHLTVGPFVPSNYAAIFNDPVANTISVPSDNSVYTQRLYYDTYSRLSEKNTWLDTTQYKINYTYNNKGQLSGLSYLNGKLVLNYEYYPDGSMQKLTNIKSDKVLWEAGDYNEYGAIASQSFGNTLTNQRTYHEVLGLLESNISGTSNTSSIQNDTYVYDGIGNVLQQYDFNQTSNNTALHEDYYYDPLDRLKDAKLNSAITVVDKYEYDSIGNITRNINTGIYNYSRSGEGKPHAVKSIEDGAGNVLGSYYYDANGNITNGDGRTITYTSFNKPIKIQKGSSYNQFTYNANNERYKRETESATIYYLDARADTGLHYEKEVKNTGDIEEKIYLYAAGQIVGTYVISNTGNSVYYFHQDNQGTIAKITNASGEIVRDINFDPFGNKRTQDWTSIDNSQQLSISNHGYLGHEHLDNVGLIHMNGRIYDPQLGRFISADPYIQYPYNQQSLNRYSYVMNNPKSNVDLSGYDVQWGSLDFYSDIVPDPIGADINIVCCNSGADSFYDDYANQFNISDDSAYFTFGSGSRSRNSTGPYTSALSGQSDGLSGSIAYGGVNVGHGVVASTKNLSSIHRNISHGSSGGIKSAWSKFKSFALGFIPGYDLVQSIKDPNAGFFDYAAGVAGLFPGGGKLAGLGIRAVKNVKNGAVNKLAGPGEDLFVGTYNQSRRGNIKSGLNSTHTPHHAVQDAVSSTTHGRGITINMSKTLHEKTRTYRKPVEQGLDTRTHLAKDVKDLRSIFRDAGYNRSTVNRQLQELIRQNKAVMGQ